MSLHSIFADLIKEETNLFDDPQKSLKEDERTKEDAGLKSENVELFWFFTDKNEDDYHIAELSGLEAGSTVMDVLSVIYEYALAECEADDYDTFILTQAYINDDEDDPKATFVIEFLKEDPDTDDEEDLCEGCSKVLKEEKYVSDHYCSCADCGRMHACDTCSVGWTKRMREFCRTCEANHMDSEDDDTDGGSSDDE